MRASFLPWVMCVASVLFAGCNSDPAPVSADYIYGQPGELSVTDPGHPLYGLKISWTGKEIPTGEAKVTVRTAKQADVSRFGTPIGPAVGMEPHGSEFTSPVTVLFPFSSKLLQNAVQGGALVGMVYRADSAAEFKALEGAVPVWTGAGGIAASERRLVAGDGVAEVETLSGGKENDARIRFRTYSFSEWRPVAMVVPTDCKTSASCFDYKSCTKDLCVSGRCQWQVLPAGSDCSDGDWRTEGDKCGENGVCISGKTIQCREDEDCRWNCITGFCNADGSCTYKPEVDGVKCEDRNVCTTGDACYRGKCTGIPRVCPHDGNQCTAVDCEPGDNIGCFTYNRKEGTICEDDDPTTDPDSCQEGVCAGVPQECDGPEKCGDGNPCTEDGCVSGRCTHNKLNGVSCDDGTSALRGAKCVLGWCIKPECEYVTDCPIDDNDCTQEFCEDGMCLIQKPTGTPCEDGDSFTYNDTCHEGDCVPGFEKMCSSDDGCDDGNPCTEEFCVKQVGLCRFQPAWEGSTCDTMDFCAGYKVCKKGVCVSENKPPCKGSENCDAEVRACLPKAGGVPCWRDRDGDGNGAGEMKHCYEPLPLGYSGNNLDCDDAKPEIKKALVCYKDEDYDGCRTGEPVSVCAVTCLPMVSETAAVDCSDGDSRYCGACDGPVLTFTCGMKTNITQWCKDRGYSGDFVIPRNLKDCPYCGLNVVLCNSGQAEPVYYTGTNITIEGGTGANWGACGTCGSCDCTYDISCDYHRLTYCGMSYQCL